MTLAAKRSEGSRLLGRVSATQGDIGAALGVSQAAVAQWAGGTKRPGTSHRQELFRLYGIALDTWDRPPNVQRTPAKDPVSAADPTRSMGEAATRLRAVLGELEAMDPGELSDQARLRRASTMANILKQLGQQTGESQEIGEARIVRLPAWRRVVEAMLRALDPWPAAQAAVAKTLDELGGGNG